ncbi:hypothetical protein Brsp01_32290 [Brucella sp. NBRC 12950]|nr:hypothetical protein Brsp01_32290 [Brucella sp. NBRC 12950]
MLSYADVLQVPYKYNNNKYYFGTIVVDIMENGRIVNRSSGSLHCIFKNNGEILDVAIAR